MRRLAKLTASVYLALACFSPFALPGQPLAKKPVVRVELKIVAEEYRICLKKVLDKVEASISQKLAKDAQAVSGLKFVTWSTAAAPGAPVLSAFLDDKKGGSGKDIFLRFNFNSQPFPLSFQIPVYTSSQGHSPGDRDKLEAKIEDLWTDRLNKDDFQQQIRKFLQDVPIANDISIPRPNLVIIPVLREDLQPGEGSELSVLFTPLESHEDDAELTLKTLRRSPREWPKSIASMVSAFEFPTGSRSTGWSDGILSVFRHKHEKSVRVFMLDYHWEFDGTTGKIQTRPSN